MSSIDLKKLLDAGVHYGHLTRKWHPNMAPYIFMERNGTHIIDLNKTAMKLEESSKALQKIAQSGRKILFVATKKQAKEILADHASACNMPYITERWPGGLMTNFVTIRKAIKKMIAIDKMKQDGTFLTLSKRERLQVDRQRAKLDKDLGSIADMTRIPGALFIVDIKREHIAVREAQKLGIPTFGIVDTNSDPEQIDFAIPANDDASKSIDIILAHVSNAVKDGLSARQAEKDKSSKKDADKAEKAEKTPKAAAKKEEAPAKKEESKKEDAPAKTEEETKA